MRQSYKTALLWVFLIVMFVAAWSVIGRREPEAKALNWSAFMTKVEQGEVREVTVKELTYKGTLRDNTRFETTGPIDASATISEKLRAAGVTVEYQPPEQAALWMQIVLIALVTLSAFGPLLRLRPLLYADDFSRLKTLADIEDPYADPRVLGLLPPREEVGKTLSLIQEWVANAQKRGEVLFMDQRQLLTFGYIKGVPLVSEYEKKYLMDQAMGDTAASTFPAFYRDLENHRFSLIISDPLRLPIKDSDYSFGEENNAWVKWVAAPILCYYEPLVTLREFKIQLLVPLGTISPDCVLPGY